MEIIYYQKYLKYKKKYLELKQKAGASVYKNTAEIGSHLAKGNVGMATAGVLFTPFSALHDLGSGVYHGTTAVTKGVHSAVTSASTAVKSTINPDQVCTDSFKAFYKCKYCFNSQTCANPNCKNQSTNLQKAINKINSNPIHKNIICNEIKAGKSLIDIANNPKLH